LCRNCGWNEYIDNSGGYTSRVKVHHTRWNMAIWSIGPNWMLRDEPNDCTLANDCDAMEFLHSQNTTIPVPKIQRLSSRTETFQFTLMARAQGEPLHKVWDSYTKEERQSVAKQLGGYIRQWRQFTAPRAQKVNGERLDDLLIGSCKGRIPSCKKIGYTTEEWLEDLTPELRQGLTILARLDKTLVQEPRTLDQLVQEYKDKFPKGGPYVFTHGDLNLSNIIVSEGKITGVIDWERAGFYPWWAERMFAHMVQDVRFHEMFDFIPDDFCPGYDRPAFIDKVSRPVARLIQLFETCPRLHRGDENTWVRRPFCECRQSSGRIYPRDMGVPPTHEIADADPELTKEDWEEFFAGYPKKEG
ncbi:kinase-like protein, partial [Rhizodiscina lignyota]